MNKRTKTKFIRVFVGCSAVMIFLGFLKIGSTVKTISLLQRNKNVRDATIGHKDLTRKDHNDFKNDNETEERKLLNNVKLLCWVMTMPNNFNTKAKAVKKTWGNRCDKLIFMSSQSNSELPSVNLGLEEGRQVLWGKTKRAFKHCYDNYLNDYDWFLKADDDTYVIIENLKYMLSIYKPKQDAIYFGSKFKLNNHPYMSGGGGYVLSRKALKLFVELGLPVAKNCKKENSGAEDAEMGKCLTKLGVIAGDSRDSLGYGRFFPFPPETHVNSIDPKLWYWTYIYYPSSNGLDCCSDLPVAFHYINANKMMEMEYLLYHAHVFGVKFRDFISPDLPPDKSNIPSWMLNRTTKKATKILIPSTMKDKNKDFEEKGKKVN